MNETEYKLSPIGYVKSEIKHRYEAPRQGILADNNDSLIRLLPRNNFTQALKGLEGFGRIWVIYGFHLNNNWKPLVTPPRNEGRKMGVFATRAPYRPNQLGLSCVKLIKVDKLNIHISESDMLDGSPVFDIKPYLPYSDSFPDSSTGWVKTRKEEEFKIEIKEDADKKIKWLSNNGGINLDNYCRVQLAFNPHDTKRKRIKELMPEGGDYVLSYRTWRILYAVDDNSKTTIIKDIFTGYSEEELRNSVSDKYEDKPLHNLYIKVFNRPQSGRRGEGS